MITKQQREQLRRMAHDLRPIAQVGKQGPTPTLITSIDQAITVHELVKVKFMDFKEERRDVSEAIAQQIGAEVVTIIGNVAIFYRENPDPARRRIELGRQAQ
ncbi:MAG TPA: YhbY family RNA-binding protein [Candidatus Kapabacteria bacterium]|jgi:RNA-binding protein|nr:YhbY family RNA-binding protein [Candidatus Kapabacteria bacterium]